MQDISIMSDRERSSPTLIESGLKNLIGGRDSNYPLISGINGKCFKSVQIYPKLTNHMYIVHTIIYTYKHTICNRRHFGLHVARRISKH